MLSYVDNLKDLNRLVRYVKKVGST